MGCYDFVNRFLTFLNFDNEISLSVLIDFPKVEKSKVLDLKMLSLEGTGIIVDLRFPHYD